PAVSIVPGHARGLEELPVARGSRSSRGESAVDRGDGQSGGFARRDAALECGARRTRCGGAGFHGFRNGASLARARRNTGTQSRPAQDRTACALARTEKEEFSRHSVSVPAPHRSDCGRMALRAAGLGRNTPPECESEPSAGEYGANAGG